MQGKPTDCPNAMEKRTVHPKAKQEGGKVLKKVGIRKKKNWDVIKKSSYPPTPPLPFTFAFVLPFLEATFRKKVLRVW